MVIFKKDQIYEQLRSDIVSWKYPDGMKLPPETEFARQLMVGKVTLRNALARLEEERLICRVRGKGTYVSYQAEVATPRSVVMVYDIQYSRRPHNFLLQLFPTFHRQALELNLKELFMTTEQLSETTTEELASFAAKTNVIGFFLFPHVYTGDEGWLKLVKGTGYPVILTNALYGDHDVTGCAAVTMQMDEGLKQAIRLLSECRYRRVAILHPFTSYTALLLSMTRDQIIAECRVNGLECNSELITGCKYDRKSILKTVTGLLNASERPDAIIVGLDEASVFVCDAIRKCGFNVGDDIGVIVYTRHENTMAVDGLTTITQDVEGATRKSFQLLLDADKWFPASQEKTAPNRYNFFRLTPRLSTRTIPAS